MMTSGTRFNPDTGRWDVNKGGNGRGNEIVHMGTISVIGRNWMYTWNVIERIEKYRSIGS